jgi:Calcineurin-like phosphoesterase
MIDRLLDQAFVGAKIKVIADAAARVERGLISSNPEMIALANENEIDLSIIKTGREILAEMSARELPDNHMDLWIPRDPSSSIVQSTLDRFYRDQKVVTKQSSGRGLARQSKLITSESLVQDPLSEGDFLGERFSKTDPRWAIAFAAAKALARAQGRYPFPPGLPPVNRLADKARVILVGDWASGLPGAERVAHHIRAALDDPEVAALDRHVVHLGDVYYAGFEHEYQERFLDLWPVRAPEALQIGSWALNGNHDMFLGGHGYFSFLTNPLFARQCGFSYFMLENENWQIFGLDSAYDPPDVRGECGDLYGAQAAWLALKRAGAPGKKVVLMTHHHLFSAYQADSTRMEARVAPILPVTAWFWGHEHRCVLFEPEPRVRHGRLIGNGGIPETSGAKRVTPAPAKILYEYLEAAPYNFSELLYFGFCILDVNGPDIKATYVNEDGRKFYSEMIS